MHSPVLIKTLIREELRNKKLTHSLEGLGFDCSYYIIDLSREIFELTGFTLCPNELFKWYFEITDAAIDKINTANFNEMLSKQVEEIYNELIKKGPLRI